MIQEIVNFIDAIPAEYHTEGLSPSQGLHILIKLDEKGESKDDDYQRVIIDKNKRCFVVNAGTRKEFEYNNDFELREFYSQYITLNKGFDSKKKFLSASPYAVCFKGSNIDKLQESFEEYFKTAVRYISNEDRDEVEAFGKFCKEKLLTQIEKDLQETAYDNKYPIWVYLDSSLEKLKTSNEKYLSSKLFNKDDFNLTVDHDVLGISGFLNSAASKKIFMLHKTSIIKDGVNNRISQNDGIPVKLYQFERLLKNKKLPYAVPIFIDKEELNREFVKIYSKDRTQSFREIIRQLFEQRAEDISNYYLINWANKMGIVINDIDYVSKFKFQLDDFIVKNVMDLPNIRNEVHLENVFDFELKIIQKMFNNALIVMTKKETVLFKYFDEIDPKYTTKINYQNILKYRKNFYDFIYKSKHDAITGNIFYDIMISIIVEDIKQDEYKDNRHSKEWGIKEKLNILFSLNKNFDKQNKNFGGLDMATKIPEYQENMRKLLNDSDYHISTDQDFAFAAGQLIYYIIKKSKSSNKSHAMLEPFINKNDPKLFHDAILRGINQYKHAFEWYGETGKGRFEKLVGEILGYECEQRVKELLPIILAGYFSQSLVLETTNN